MPRADPSSRNTGQTFQGKLGIVEGLGADVPELRRARALWQMNRFDEALAAFEAATRRYPQNLLALVDASRALGARFEIDRAEAMLERLLKVGRQRPEVLHFAGQSYRMIFRPEKAMECFERALARTRQIPDAYLELAVLYERRHRVGEALSLVEDCLRQEPGYCEAELFKARLLRRIGEPSAAAALLRRLSTSESAEPQARAQAWAEIAQALDRDGDYGGAMEAMLQCKGILLEREGPVRRESDAVLGQLLRWHGELGRAHFQRWSAALEGLPRQRVAVLCSFPRSGTTLLEQVLDSHPGLVSSDEREAFARDIFPAMWLSPSTPEPTVGAMEALAADRLQALRQRYVRYMSAALNEPIGDRMHLDKNPPMTLLLPAFLRLFPEARLLIALRDPRDVVLSCFMQYLPLNPNSVCYLTLERTAARYAADMGAWRRLRELIPAPWKEVRYEAAVANLEGVAKETLEFLELPWNPAVMNYRDRLQHKAVRSPTYEAVTQPLYTRSIGRWKHYERYLEPVLPLLHESLKAFGY